MEGKNRTIIGIDASNLKRGGGLTHLLELIKNIDNDDESIERIIIYGGKSVVKISETPKLKVKHIKYFDGNFLLSSYWKLFKLSSLFKEDKIDILYNPGGGYIGVFKPYVTMSRNMLPFENKERLRYGYFSILNFKFAVLNFIQRQSFKAADGVIFLSKYAKETISCKTKISNSIIIPHGISSRFEHAPIKCYDIGKYDKKNPFKIIYVSIIDMYKHQWNVAEAVSILVQKGYPLELTLIGDIYEPAYKKLDAIIKKVDPQKEFIKYIGLIPYEEIDRVYKNSDLFVFASTCENMPNILIEAMSSGLPIASSNYAPMPEFLKDAGIYFDPLSVESIYKSIETCLIDTNLRQNIAVKAKEYAQTYSWEKCAKETIAFIKACKN